jgi:1-acyl-sn-glycerol-3-phosphate acyltransferase
MYLYKKIMGAITSLRCLLAMFNASAIIFISSFVLRKKHRLLTNRVAHYTAKKVMRMAKATYTVQYLQPLLLAKNQIYIFMSNHQSLIDLPLIYATVKETIRPVTKSELFRIPMFGRAMRVGECVPVNRRDPSQRENFLVAARKILSNGVSIWMFPEGTRSRDGQLLPFKSGGFQLAADMSATIIPVGILNTAAVLPAGKMLIALNKQVTIRIGEPIEARLFSHIDMLKEHVRHSIAELIRA